jgi:hypothetical protein
LDLEIVAAIENNHIIIQKQSTLRCHGRIALVRLAYAGWERNDLRKDHFFHPLVFACYLLVRPNRRMERQVTERFISYIDYFHHLS